MIRTTNSSETCSMLRGVLRPTVCPFCCRLATTVHCRSGAEAKAAISGAAASVASLSLAFCGMAREIVVGSGHGTRLGGDGIRLNSERPELCHLGVVALGGASASASGRKRPFLHAPVGIGKRSSPVNGFNADPTFWHFSVVTFHDLLNNCDQVVLLPMLSRPLPLIFRKASPFGFRNRSDSKRLLAAAAER
jgi:hypothetical protein